MLQRQLFNTTRIRSTEFTSVKRRGLRGLHQGLKSLDALVTILALLLATRALVIRHTLATRCGCVARMIGKRQTRFGSKLSVPGTPITGPSFYMRFEWGKDVAIFLVAFLPSARGTNVVDTTLNVANSVCPGVAGTCWRGLSGSSTQIKATNPLH